MKKGQLMLKLKTIRQKLQSNRERLSLLFAALLALPASYCFQLNGAFIACFITLAVFLLFPAIRYLLGSKERQKDEEEFTSFLDYLSGRTSTGIHLGLALEEAYRHLRNELRKDGRLHFALSRCSRALASGLSPELALQRFRHDFPLEQAELFSRLLPGLAKQGGKLDIFLQLYRDNLQKEGETRREAAAEQSSAASECLIMSLMPFIMALIGRQIPYLRLDQNIIGNQIANLILALAAVLLFSLCLRLLAYRHKSWQATSRKLLPERRYSHPFFWHGQQILQQLYPESFQLYLRRSLQRIFPGDSHVWSAFLDLKIYVFLAFPLVFFLSIFLQTAVIFLIFLFTFFYPELKLIQSVAESKRAEREEYPLFLNLIALLLASGLSLDRSLRLLLSVLPKEGEKNKKLGLLARDLAYCERQLKSGMTAAQALSSLALLQNRSEIAQVLHQVSRYDREGGQEQLNMIRMQAIQTREMYRLALKARLSHKGLLYLLPMGLDLLLIVGICLWPVVKNLSMGA